MSQAQTSSAEGKGADTPKYGRDDLVARLVRAGELEVSGESPDEVGDYFAPDYKFHGAGGWEADYASLASYFASIRAAFDDRSIRRGITIVEGSDIACQTWIEGTFVHEFTQSPVGPVAPNGKRVVFSLLNIFRMDVEGRIIEEYVQPDNTSVLKQLGVTA